MEHTSSFALLQEARTRYTQRELAQKIGKTATTSQRGWDVETR